MNLEDDNRINRTNNLMGTMEKITEVSQEKLRLLDTEQLLAFAGIFGTLSSPKAKAMVKGISKELQRRKYSLGEEKLNEVDVKSLLKGLGRGAKSAAKGLKTAIKTGYPIAKKMAKATWMLSKKVGGAIGELMDDPEFRKLFTKYVDNPDDPNRAKKIQAYADSMLSSSPVSGMESVDIKLQKARIEKICSVVLGEGYDHDFIYEDIDFTKPSAIKNAYEKYIFERRGNDIACVKCDEVNTVKAWQKNGGTCPEKGCNSTQGVFEFRQLTKKQITEIEWDPINNKYMGAGSDWMNEEELEEKQLAGLKKKAEKSGIAYGILKKVFDRGMAAWKTGHRPGATPHQWAYARVNSFITGGKTRTTADADLWAKHKGKKESIEEAKEPFAVVCDGEVLGTYSKEPMQSQIKALARDNKVDFKKCKVVKTKKKQNVGSPLKEMFELDRKGSTATYGFLSKNDLKAFEKIAKKHGLSPNRLSKPEEKKIGGKKYFTMTYTGKVDNLVAANKEVSESTLNYARTLKAIEKDRKMKNISDKDKETLAKIADLMKKLKEEKACPVATQDLKTNTENRDATIKKFNYGPLNVDEPGSYWKDIAKYWKTTEEAAKKSLCENCVAFDISPRMKDCMPGETSDKDGELGYCWMHHFKCHSARSCHTWAKGGPITDDDTSLDWQKRSKI